MKISRGGVYVCILYHPYGVISLEMEKEMDSEVVEDQVPSKLEYIVYN